MRRCTTAGSKVSAGEWQGATRSMQMPPLLGYRKEDGRAWGQRMTDDDEVRPKIPALSLWR